MAFDASDRGASRIQVRVKGAKDMRRALRRVGADLNDVSRTHREIAKLVAGDARKYAPRGPTGNLKTSIKASGTRTKARVRSSLAYAGVIHWGWPERNIETNRFIDVAVDRNRANVRTLYLEAMQRIAVKAGFISRRIG